MRWFFCTHTKPTCMSLFLGYNNALIQQKVPMSRKPNTLDTAQLEAIIIDALEDIKAQDITILDTAALTDEFDKVIIATASSNRQTRALANNVREKVKEKGGDILSTEGEETGEWVLVDCGDIVVHLMQAPIRAYYNLEELWDGRA